MSRRIQNLDVHSVLSRKLFPKGSGNFILSLKKSPCTQETPVINL